MINYLISLSFVWLACLLFFDLLLKKETFHKMNRIYLLSTILLGLLLPFLSFRAETIRGSAAGQPSIRIHQVKETIAQTIAPVTAFAVTAEIVLWFMYLLGVAVSLVLVVREYVVLITLYRKGKKTKSAPYTLIETGKPHSPFSFGNEIFITSKEQYDAKELHMIITHELQHGRHFHAIDKLILTLLRISFWFHPLIHIYYKRLMLVHEYEADNFSKKEAQLYGSFLVEQSLLQSHSIITHSFNYSPIKNRITMLTKKQSPKVKLFKYAFMIPMLLVFLVCCTEEIKLQQNRERKQVGDIITFKGNEFELSKNLVDSIVVEDPATGEMTTAVIRREPYPIKMNGKKIWGWNEDGTAQYNEPPVLQTDEGNIGLLIFQKLKDDLAKLDDEEYEIYIDNLIIDDHGSSVYYDIPYLTDSKTPLFRYADEDNSLSPNNQNKAADPSKNELNSKITERICDVMDNDMKFTPAHASDGKAVISLLQSKIKFSVKNHKAQFLNS